MFCIHLCTSSAVTLGWKPVPGGPDLKKSSSFKFKEGFRLTLSQSLFVLVPSQIANAHLKTGHMGSRKSFPPCSNEENHGAEVESSKQFAQRRSTFSLAGRAR